MPSERKNIIITADDYGCCEFIDRGIIKGISKGVISCVSTFINFAPRSANERGGAYQGSIEAIKELLRIFPNIPIGLHLSINAGTPVSQQNKVDHLLRRNKIDGQHYFRSFSKFDPDLYFKKRVISQIVVEVQSQIDLFKKEFGAKNLNHLSCHYGTLFHFEKILKGVLEIKEFHKCPIRNPILAFQIPVSRKEKGKRELKQMQKFFKSKSKMRIEGIGNLFRWSDTVENFISLASQGGSVKKRLALLQNNKTRFPEFTIDYLYRRQQDFKNMAVPISKLSRHKPSYYLKPGQNSPIYEFIVHVGSGRMPDTGPVGVNKSYFNSRKLELKRLVDSQNILKTNSINLVDFRSVGK